jgi:hypothetical protein
VLLKKVPSQWGFLIWEILITHPDGSTTIDWEAANDVDGWYEHEPHYLKRIV